MVHKSLRYLFSKEDLIMQQIRCMKIHKDYDNEILYHPGEANMVVDSLSHKDISERT